jgi:hypothetical protein
MTYESYWVDEPWIYRVDYTDYLTLEVFDQAMVECLEIVNEHPTNFLCDFSQVEFYDGKAIRSQYIRKFLQHPNTKWFALVGMQGALMKFAIAVLGRFVAFKQFDDIASALEFLNTMAEHQKQESIQPQEIS